MLAGEEGLSVGRALEREGRAHEAIVARTCVVDEFVAAAAREVDAVYSFGAGLCTRRLRLGIELPWTEVDLPALVSWKDVAAAPLPGADKVRRVGLDLRDTPAVSRLLSERVEPRLLVVLEGVLVYLEEKEVVALLTVLGARVGSTRVVLDLGGGLWASLFARRTRATVGAHGTPYRTSLRQGRKALAKAGFEVLADRSLVDWDAATPAPRFYRPPSAWLVPGFADVARVLEARAPRRP